MDDREYIKELGVNITAARKKLNITQQELAYRLDIDKSNLIRIEKGRTNPTVKTLRRIALCLNVDIRDFFDIDEISA